MGSVLVIPSLDCCLQPLCQGLLLGLGEQTITVGVSLHLECFREAEGRPGKAEKRKENPSKFSPLPSAAAPGGTELHNTVGFNKMPLTHKVCLLPAP